MRDSFDISNWVRITSDWVGSSIKLVDSLITYPNENGEAKDAYKVTASKLATALYRTLDINHPKFFKMDDQSKLGFVGSYILLDEIRLELEANDEAVAMLFANSTSSLETDRKYQETVGSEGTGSPAKFVYTLPNIVIGEVCLYWNQHNETQFLVLPKFDPEALFKHSQIMFNESDCKHVLIGWTEVGNDQVDGLFVLLTKNEAGLATVNDLSQLYTQ